VSGTHSLLCNKPLRSGSQPNIRWSAVRSKVHKSPRICQVNRTLAPGSRHEVGSIADEQHLRRPKDAVNRGRKSGEMTGMTWDNASLN
jgi:hypothetical protein